LLGRFQLEFDGALARFEFRDACRFFDEGAAVERFR
jgi:hypothetical protein